ncbi:MAG: hypothetical protein QNK05_03835 [Myxococcota bacterium]|nr:hypothetical protein [Myxococcota bacterium]
MDLGELAAWGEFLGGIGGIVAAAAVVASLIFVGVQLRASVNQARVDSYTRVTELWTNFCQITAADEESWGIWFRGTHDYASLSPEQQARFGFLLSMYFGILDCIFVHQDLGVWVSDETYRRVSDQAYAVFGMPGVQAWWQENRGRVFAPRVEAYLVERMGAARPPASS